MDEVEIVVSKPPQAWKGIPYVEKMKLDLGALREPTVLYEGMARGGVPHFPANVNIAAVLSMAGIGFDRTRLKVVPIRTSNTIRMRSRCGRNRQHTHQARERASTRESENRVARMLQRVSRTETGEIADTLRHVTVADSEA